MAFYNDCFSLLTMFLTSYQQEDSNYEKGFINSFYSVFFIAGMVKRKQTFIHCSHWATGIFMTLNILMIHANYKYTGVG